jgi:hypothetical protein
MSFTAAGVSRNSQCGIYYGLPHIRLGYVRYGLHITYTNPVPMERCLSVLAVHGTGFSPVHGEYVKRVNCAFRG